MPKRPLVFKRNDDELKVAGRNACRALFDKRPHDVRRAYLTEENIPHFADALRFCARERIAYHIKTSADLDQIAETVHHDGVLFLARAQPPLEATEALLRVDALRGPVPLVLLENVKNPHNVGAILRVCAHFGVPFVLGAGQTAALSPAVMRTAEGGAEHCPLVAVSDGVSMLDELRRRGFTVLATSSHTTSTLEAAPLEGRVVFLFGSEGEGLSDRLLGMADGTVAIPGSGALESLNVACASSVILWEHFRRAGRGERPSTRPPRTDGRSQRAPQASAPAHTRNRRGRR